MGCSPSGSSVHGNFQTRIWKWFAISYTRGSSQPRGQTRMSCVSYISRQILSHLGKLRTMQDVLTCIISFYPSPMETGTIIPILQLWKQRLVDYGARICWLKKLCTMWDLWVKFYLGQNEDYSLRDSISDIQRNCSKEAVVGSVYIRFWWRDYTCNQALILAETCCHEEQMSLRMILVLL